MRESCVASIQFETPRYLAAYGVVLYSLKHFEGFLSFKLGRWSVNEAYDYPVLSNRNIDLLVGN